MLRTNSNSDHDIELFTLQRILSMTTNFIVNTIIVSKYISRQNMKGRLTEIPQLWLKGSAAVADIRHKNLSVSHMDWSSSKL